MNGGFQKDINVKYILKVIFFCIVFTVILIAFSFAKGLMPENYERIAHGILGTVAALSTTFLFLKYDKKKFSDIELVFERKTILKFLTGVAAGILIMGMLALSVIWYSDVVIESNPNSNFFNFIVFTLPLLPLAYMEEVAFRAYPLELLKKNAGIRTAIFLTSLLFGLYHLVNGWTIFNSFTGAAVWGLVFALAAVYSNGIAMPTGIHYAANLTTAAFGSVNNNLSLWTAKENESIVKNQAVDWAVIFPSAALFIFAIILTEVYVRKLK